MALPAIRKLAQVLQISVITTKRAYDELEKEGFIDSVGGKGTFVAARPRLCAASLCAASC
jgi:GntR family transcriptional regulator